MEGKISPSTKSPTSASPRDVNEEDDPVKLKQQLNQIRESFETKEKSIKKFTEDHEKENEGLKKENENLKISAQTKDEEIEKLRNEKK